MLQGLSMTFKARIMLSGAQVLSVQPMALQKRPLEAMLVARCGEKQF